MMVNLKNLLGCHVSEFCSSWQDGAEFYEQSESVNIKMVGIKMSYSVGDMQSQAEEAKHPFQTH